MSTAGLDLDRMLDVAWVRSQFPALEAQVNGQTAAFLTALRVPSAQPGHFGNPELLCEFQR